MKLRLNSFWFLFVLAFAVTSCEEEEDDVVNRNPVLDNSLEYTLEDVLFTEQWEVYDWRTLENRVIVNGKELSHTETYAVEATGSYEFRENTTQLRVKNEFFVYGTVNANDDAIFPDTIYNTPALKPAEPYIAQYKIINDTTLVATAFSPDEMTAYNIEKDRIYLRQVLNNLTVVDTIVTTTTAILEIDLAPVGTKREERLK